MPVLPLAFWKGLVPTGLFASSAKDPTAVLYRPVVFAASAEVPKAVFELPVVLLVSALNPAAVFQLHW